MQPRRLFCRVQALQAASQSNMVQPPARARVVLRGSHAGKYIDPMWTLRSTARHSQPAAGLRLPTQCEICRLWGRERFCTRCVAAFAPPHGRCGRCALRLSGDIERCGECLREPPPFTRTLCAVDYAFPWDRLIAGFKFHGRPELAGPMSRLMLQAARSTVSDLPTTALLVPVPLSAARLAERGYNQAWELARRLARATGLRALPRALERVIDTRHQAELDRAQRMANLRAAFLVPSAARGELEGRHVLLVDDVVTTGATAREAATTLLRAGAGQVVLWVLARTGTD